MVRATGYPKKIVHAVRRHIKWPDRYHEPWALEMATDCLDVRTGQILHFPRAGGWHDQEPGELAAMRHAWQAGMIFSRPRGKWSKSDQEFVKWMQAADGDTA